MKDSLEKELVYHDYVHREEGVLRAGYNPELEFYSSVKSGDVRKVRELCREPLHMKHGLGKLSDQDLQSLKYHFAITAALLARYCIEGGMTLSDSYGLSDFYIRKADRAKKSEVISELHLSMCLDYTKRMKSLRKNRITSLPVAKAVDYIYEHLHTRITLDQLSKETGVSGGYLSRQFRKDTGLTITEYIRSKKIETAANMLVYSDFTPAEIATILAFPSQSYFTEVFRKEKGMTPAKYRTENRFRIDIGAEK